MLFLPQDDLDLYSSASTPFSTSQPPALISRTVFVSKLESKDGSICAENYKTSVRSNQDLIATKHCRARSMRRRAIINSAIASEIFLLKMSPLVSKENDCPRKAASVGDSVAVSRIYGISPKAVRDIWNRFAICSQYCFEDRQVIIYGCDDTGAHGSMLRATYGRKAVQHLPCLWPRRSSPRVFSICLSTRVHPPSSRTCSSV